MERITKNALLVVVASVIFSLIVFVMDTVVGISPANSAWKGVVGFIYSFL